jgi:hypothetical protein
MLLKIWSYASANFTLDFGKTSTIWSGFLLISNVEERTDLDWSDEAFQPWAEEYLEDDSGWEAEDETGDEPPFREPREGQVFDLLAQENRAILLGEPGGRQDDMPEAPRFGNGVALYGRRQDRRFRPAFALSRCGRPFPPPGSVCSVCLRGHDRGGLGLPYPLQSHPYLAECHQRMSRVMSFELRAGTARSPTAKTLPSCGSFRPFNRLDRQYQTRRSLNRARPRKTFCSVPVVGIGDYPLNDTITEFYIVHYQVNKEKDKGR